MPDYDFRSLSPIDFEILVRDLLQDELGIRLESFKTGRDKGIDLRYCPIEDETLIIQCKHYSGSSFDKLYRHLQKNELEKVQKLQPAKYILATSLGLTVGQKDKIKSLFNPFILTTGDIFGKEELNNLLGKFPKIEKRTFKLWLTSLPIFEDILHSKVKNVSRDTLERIRQHAQYYVQNKSFQEAIEILHKHNFCIIAGIPGIGKTLLAEMLCLYYIENGYEIVKISTDISEAQILDHSVQKRIYYYDDFLGQTSLSEKLNKNEDQALLDFILAIRSSKKSKLILTTREYILNQARMMYEKIARAKFSGETYIIDLSKYTRLIRAKILFNHIYFSDLSENYKKSILENRNYLKIIDHKNYNPRIIDLMTQLPRIDHISPTRYFDRFMSNMDNPLEIWRHAFEEQLSRSSINLLLVMITMPDAVFLNDIEEAFKSFHHHQAKQYNFDLAPRDFSRALKELEGNFITIEKSRDKYIVKFHNPSIRDFLKHYLNSNEHELIDLLNRSVFFDQMMILWGANNTDNAKFRKTISKYPSEFILSLRKTINSRACRLINYSVRGSICNATWDISFEDRVNMISSFVGTIKSDDADKFLDNILVEVEKNIESGNANRQYLVLLLKQLQKMNKISLKTNESILEKSKILLLDNLQSINEFSPLCNFDEFFPEILSDSERLHMVKEFNDVAYNDCDYSSNDPDYYRRDAYQIDEIAKKLVALSIGDL